MISAATSCENRDPKQILSGMVRLALPLVLAIASAFFVLAVRIDAQRLGSFTSIIEYICGRRLFVVDSFKSIEAAHAGDLVTLRHVFLNVSGKPISLIGSAVSCTCTIVDNIPTLLKNSEERAISATVSVPKDLPEFPFTIVGDIRVFTDEPKAPEVVLQYRIRILGSRPSVEARSQKPVASVDLTSH